MQHFPRTLARSDEGSNPDFRLPTLEELAAMEAFMLAQEFPSGEDPSSSGAVRDNRIPEAGPRGLRRLRVRFLSWRSPLSQTTISIQGKPVGVNAAFDTGTSSGRFGGSLPCEPPPESGGACGSGEFSTPQLFNLPHLGPLFHNGSARTLAEAVDFYLSAEFGSSPANRALISQGVGIVPTNAITAFLERLVERPYTVDGGPVRFGARSTDPGRPGVEAITVSNTGPSALRFDSSACRLAGPDPDQFAIASCPLAPELPVGESRTILATFDPDSEGLKSAILEIHPVDAAPSGVDLFGVGGSLGPPPGLSDVRPATGSEAA